MTRRESSSTAGSGAIGDAVHRVALGTLALTRAGVRHTATLIDGVVGGGLQAAGGAIDAANDAARLVVRTVGSRAGDVIELRITRVLNALQIPTSRDVNELAQRVERLSQMVAAQASGEAPAKTPRPGKPRSRRKTSAGASGAKARTGTRKKAAKGKTATRANGSGRRRSEQAD